MRDIWGKLAARGAAGIAMGITVGLLAGGSYVVASRAPEDAPGKSKAPATTESEVETEDEGVHGGTVERFHGDGQTPCDVPAGVTLEGNWTHGDYVSAWAATDDAEAHKAAAKGPCGKPQKSVDAKNGARGKSGDAPGHNKSEAGTTSRGKSGDAPGKNKPAGTED